MVTVSFRFLTRLHSAQKIGGWSFSEGVSGDLRKPCRDSPQNRRVDSRREISEGSTKTKLDFPEEQERGFLLRRFQRIHEDQAENTSEIGGKRLPRTVRRVHENRWE